MKKLFLICLALLITISAMSQELRCTIQVSASKVQGTNRQIFEKLQGALNEFMNGRTWSNYKFSANERIECSMLLNIQDYAGDHFKGTLQIQVRRPVYNSSYNTVLLNYVDNDLEFNYVEDQSLEYSETSHLSNITSIMAYYANVILGFNFDSFSLYGGTEFFKRAEKVVNNSQNANERGWRAGESTSRKNRYWLVTNILNEEYAPVREFMYVYHRLGMDLLYDKLVEARTRMAESLNLLNNISKNRPDQFMHFFNIVLEAKSDEFVNVFQGSLDDEKRRVSALLSQTDPAHAEKYKRILNPVK